MRTTEQYLVQRHAALRSRCCSSSLFLSPLRRRGKGRRTLAVGGDELRTIEPPAGTLGLRLAGGRLRVRTDDGCRLDPNGYLHGTRADDERASRLARYFCLRGLNQSLCD